ncbi:MAG: cobaltochelatase subunit CobN [Pseudomonadota bacterium]
MHVLATQKVPLGDQAEPVDLGLSPADIVILSAADTELACLSRARHALPPDAPSLRLANFLALQHPYSVDLFVERMLPKARLIIIRLLGGRSYWSYGIEQLTAACAERVAPLALLPGDGREDPKLAELSTVSRDTYARLWRYFQEGGLENAEHALRYASTLIGLDLPWNEPAPLPKAGFIERNEAADAFLIFYRALFQAGDLEVVDALRDACHDNGVSLQAIYVTSLKDPEVRAYLEAKIATHPPDVIFNMTGFAVAGDDVLRGVDCPVLQLVPAANDAEWWQESTFGLTPRDLAMHVALPEVDGRVLANIVSFKTQAPAADPLTEIVTTHYAPHEGGIRYAAELAAAWLELRRKPARDRRIAIVLANYPARDGRLANGVGLDVPTSTMAVLQAMHDAGYSLSELPDTSADLLDALRLGPTNELQDLRQCVIQASLDLGLYLEAYAELPQTLREAVETRWGPPEADPRLVNHAFSLAVVEFGNVVVALQPARGYELDPDGTYHDPDLVPPHGYLAFYIWLRRRFEAEAVVQLGKHGNLEWLPGKALGLSEECWPRAILGATPLIYPFIVNDPGEGTQAKRRNSAVIVDHLTPPLARAESHGHFAELERSLDEYAQAQILDPTRARLLRNDILDHSRNLGLAADLGLDLDAADDNYLGAVDTHLCELKELQIRDGLHVLGTSPEAGLRTSTLAALARHPRGADEGPTASLLRALADDLKLGFDPLDCDFGAPWLGPRPEILEGMSSEIWRIRGDTVERLELLATALIAGEHQAPAFCERTRAVLGHVDEVLAPKLDRSGAAEIQAILGALDGRAVPPGPSGAPSRGRPEVLPTGRNFFSVDTRAVPTSAAWRLGWKSAERVLETYLQIHGLWPKRIAMSAWGTSNMRTGGDDIAQALALLGVRPLWDDVSGRLIGTEVMPHDVLGRPRVDVTFRISGFFRDAFPAQIELLDDAFRAVAALDEPKEQNPIASRVREDAALLAAQGLDDEASVAIAGSRIFGSMPGSYGAGLQSLLEHGGWQGDAELAEAYLAWGAFSYGRKLQGSSQKTAFAQRLKGTNLILHNQDNREHDLLDSDDYYQFEGGLAAAVRHLSGAQPEIFHNDHSRPESPRIRTLRHEIGLIVRGRAANPKWLKGVMRHGYKGAFEIAATVDYLFAFAATARVVEDHHFEAVFDAYLDDQEVVDFLDANNRPALNDIIARFEDAIDRGLWQPRKNSVQHRLDALRFRKESENEAGYEH